MESMLGSHLGSSPRGGGAGRRVGIHEDLSLSLQDGIMAGVPDVKGFLPYRGTAGPTYRGTFLV